MSRTRLRPLRWLRCSLFGHPDDKRRRLFAPFARSVTADWRPVAAWCDYCGASLKP